VGAVARDVHGNLAAATSTGGITNKKYGRVGDSPIIGAGVFADNETCAVSATGYGEQFIRTTLSKTVSEYVKYLGMNAQEASDEAIKYLVAKVKGLGGVIVVDKDGNFGSSFSTEDMIHGKADANSIEVLT
jgi:beta-aspartyl-peptidase (threonine type)